MSTAYGTRRTVREGFTFIELVIAIAILGILALIVAPKMFNYLREAEEETTKTNLKVVRTEIDNYIRKVGQPPQTLRDLVRRPADMTDRQWRGPYLEGEEIPKDGQGHDLVYVSLAGNHPPYKLYSWGKNGPDSPSEEWIYPS